VHTNQRYHREGSSGRSRSNRLRGRGRSRSFSSAVGRLCGGSQDDSSDDESNFSAKCPMKRTARHSVDVEVPNQSICHLYPLDDNYIPHPTNPTLRQPKSLSALCIDAVCRNLPDLEGELPPNLPQEVVDRIVSSLTSHAALNSTTLRMLRRCELGSLSLANCRGVCDEWLIPLSSSSLSSGDNDYGCDNGHNYSSNSDGKGGGFASSGDNVNDHDGRVGRMRSASTTSNDCHGGSNFASHHHGGYSSLLPASPPPVRNVLHPTQFVQMTLLGGGTGGTGGAPGSSNSIRMDLDDHDDMNSGLDSSAFGSGGVLQPLPLQPPAQVHREQDVAAGQSFENHIMEEECCDDDVESFESRCTSSFVSASSTPYVDSTTTAGGAEGIDEDGDEDGEEKEGARDTPPSSSPLLPSILPPPEFFSLKWTPPASSSSLWLYPMRSSAYDDHAMLALPSLDPDSRKPPAALPGRTGNGDNDGDDADITKAHHHHQHMDNSLYNDDMSYDGGDDNDNNNINNDASYFPPPSSSPTGISSTTTSTLHLLDLRGSQRLTDRGLLQLAHTPLRSLEVVRLDNCHGITGRGLLAFSRSTMLHTLSLANCRRLTDEAVVNVGHLGGSLTCLNLGGCRCLTDRSLEAVGHLRELRKLDLSQCDLITDEGLVNLHDLELLDELSIGWCRLISDDGLEILAEQPNRSKALITLRLARCSITDEGLQHLAKLETLEELDLNGCVRISSAALGETLGKLIHLTSLDVSYCPGILRSSWQGKIDSLKSLELCYSGVRDSHLAHLRSLPKLEELNLDSCIVTDWGMAHLVDNDVVPYLTTLDLADTDISDAAMGKIARLKHIRHLSLFYCNISNRGLRHIASMSSLEVLNLDSRDIGDDGLRYLRELPLTSLDLFSSRVTDIGCAHLSKIKTLTSLELCGGGIRDFGCAQLATLSNLTSLNLSQNESITNRGAACLAALTNLKALNLSNTCVTSDALKFFGGLRMLQSLALYGCKDMEDSVERLGVLQRELPSLRCLRLNSPSNEDGVIDHNVETEEEEDEDDDEEEDETYYEEADDEDDESEDSLEQGLLAHVHHHQLDDSDDGESMGSSEGDSMSDDFHDAYNEVQSVDTASQQSRNMDYDI